MFRSSQAMNGKGEVVMTGVIIGLGVAFVWWVVASIIGGIKINREKGKTT